MPLEAKKKKKRKKEKESGCSGDSKRNFPRVNSPTQAKAIPHETVTFPGFGGKRGEQPGGLIPRNIQPIKTESGRNRKSQ